jgi:hypothetical protein
VPRTYLGKAGVRATGLDSNVDATISTFQSARLADRDTASAYGLNSSFLPGMYAPTCEPKILPSREAVLDRLSPAVFLQTFVSEGRVRTALSLPQTRLAKSFDDQCQHHSTTNNSCFKQLCCFVTSTPDRSLGSSATEHQDTRRHMPFPCERLLQHGYPERCDATQDRSKSAGTDLPHTLLVHILDAVKAVIKVESAQPTANFSDLHLTHLMFRSTNDAVRTVSETLA